MERTVACSRCGTRFPDRSTAEIARDVGDGTKEGGILDRSTWWVMGFGLLVGGIAWVAHGSGMRTVAVVLGGLAALCVGVVALFWLSNTAFSLLLAPLFLLRMCPSCWLGRLVPTVEFSAHFPRALPGLSGAPSGRETMKSLWSM